MFPNAWARLLAEAGIDSRTINKKSAELRSAMLEGQREIWEIRNDLKHNTPLTTEEAREIDKAFLRMDKLKLKRFDDSPDSIKRGPGYGRHSLTAAGGAYKN